jgi:hypothetical protein
MEDLKAMPAEEMSPKGDIYGGWVGRRPTKSPLKADKQCESKTAGCELPKFNRFL